MNLIEIYVTNITNIGKANRYNYCNITADFDCCGYKEIQKTKSLHIDDINSIKRYGYYLGQANNLKGR